MKIAVLGGGISGLSSTYFLKKQFPQAQIQIIESSHWGGWIKSVERNDTIFETGPRTLRPRGLPGAFTLDLVEELGLESRLLTVPKSSVAAKNRFVYSQSQLQKLPSSILGLLFENPKIFKGIPSEIFSEFFNRNPRKICANDESIQAFLERRYGPKTANLASAIIHGIYAGDTNELSIKSTLGVLSQLEDKYGSVGQGVLKTAFSREKDVENDQYRKESHFVKDIQSRSSIYSFKNGLQEFSDKILANLVQSPNVNLIQDKCTKIVFEVDNRPTVITETGQIQVDHVISALPAHVLSNLLSKEFQEISNILKTIPSVTVGVVNLAFPSFVKLPVSGFGYLIPKSENNNESILGTIFDSDAMPFQSRIPLTRLTVMMGGYRFNSLFGDPEKVSHDHLGDIAINAVKKHLKIAFDPIDMLVNVHQKCIPQYTVGHDHRMSILHHLLSVNHKVRNRLTLVGASYTGVSVNDCAFESFKSIQRFSKNGNNGVTGLEKFLH